MTAPGEDKKNKRAPDAIRTTMPAAVTPGRPKPAPPPDSEGEDGRIFQTRQLVGGIYEIEALLGEGGMGQVYAALDKMMNRRVAIKALRRGVDPILLRHEAEALAAIHHPGVLTAHAMGSHEGIEFLVLERVAGISLAEYASRRLAAADPLSVVEVLELLLSITDALSAVHRAGIAHRDIKPHNILLAPGDRVVIADFGLVTSEQQAHHSGEALGTPAYMAPEIIGRELRKGAAHLADLYSVGVIAFELLTGDLPFKTENAAQLLRDHVMAPAPDARLRRPDTPAALSALVASLLAKRPADRPASAEAVLWQLRRMRRALDERPRTAPRIIVVDDDPVMAKLMAISASSVTGATIEVANDAATALRLLRREAAALMILDLAMPGMSGVELCMYLRGSPLASSCAIIAVSASAGVQDEELLRQLGVSHLLPKGGSFLTRLAAALRETLG